MSSSEWHYSSQGSSSFVVVVVFFVGLRVLCQVSASNLDAFSEMNDKNGITESSETTAKLSPSFTNGLPIDHSTPLSSLSRIFNTKVEENMLTKSAGSVNLSDSFTVMFKAISVTIPWDVEQSATSAKEQNPVFTTTNDHTLNVTSDSVDNNITMANTTEFAAGSTLPLMAICISVVLGSLVVIVVIVTVTCICYRRRSCCFRKKLLEDPMNWRRSEVSNDYENLDNFTDWRGSRGVRVYPDVGDDIHLRPVTMLPNYALLSRLTSANSQQILLNDYRQLNEHLLTLKRPLENYVTNDSVSDDLNGNMSNTSSKILDIIWQSTGNVRHRRPIIVPPLRTFAYEILNSDVFILENLMALHLQIATLLQVFPVIGDAPILNQCHHSLESVDALLKIGIEMVSYTSFVKSGYNDILLDANPVFHELLGQLTVIRLRLESYHLLDACIEPDDSWKSKLLDYLTEAESSITETFSDVLESSDALETESIDGEENFHRLLKRKLLRFRRSTDPIMPQVKRFLQGIDGSAAYYASITLDEIGQLITNILDPRAGPTLPEDEPNPEIIYQNLSSVYDLPHRSVYTFPNQADVDISLTESPLSVDLRPMQNDDDYEEDIYEEAPGTLHAAIEDISNAYDEDYFEVVVDRTSPSCLENVLQCYKNTPLDQLQRSIRVSFVGEAGLDGGALSREFFFMSFNSLIGQPFLSHLLFEGSRGHLLPAIDHVLTDSKVYWFVGVLIAQAMNKGCKGLPGLCDAVRHFLSHGAKIKNIGESLEKVTVEDIADGELRMVIEKVQKKESLTEDERLVFENWARDSNFSKVLSPTTELEAVQRIFAHYVFNSRMTQLQAISEGINDVLIRSSQTSEIERMFPVDEKLNYDDFMSGILIEPSNECQQKADDYFKRFCQELHAGSIDGLTLELLLQFFTGAPYYVSMVGAQVRFAEPQDKNSLPVAHACASELILPTVHADYVSFRCAMVKALEYSGTGFGIV